MGGFRYWKLRNRLMGGNFWSECSSKHMNQIHIENTSKLFFTVGEVSSQFGISPKSVYRLLERGVLQSSPALRKKMIPRASIETFIAASLQGGAR